MNDRSSDAAYRAPRAALSLADFELLRRIGDGSYSQVVLARHRATGREYALKVIDKHYIIRHKVVDHVKRERALLDRLSDGGIVQLHFTFQDALSLYMGLEHCPNGELYDQIRVAGRLEEGTTRFYAAEVVLMLEALRREGVVHRDIKPENLLLTAEGHLKLIDFGSAKQLPPEEVLPPGLPREEVLPPGLPWEGPGAEDARPAAGGASDQQQQQEQGQQAVAGAGCLPRQQGQQQGQQQPCCGPGSAQSAGAPAGQHCSAPSDSGALQGGPPPQQAQRAEQAQQDGASQQQQQQGADSSGSSGDEGEVERGGRSRKRAVSLVGTADYVSPEILRNERCSCASDLWALGCVVYQMLVGRAPFKSGSEYLTFQRILDGTMELPDWLAPEARDLVQRLLEQDPARRIGAADLAELKAHPFFAGVDWERLRELPAPRFIAPDLESIGSDAGSFDWELQSLSAALPHISSTGWEPTGGSDSSD